MKIKSIALVLLTAFTLPVQLVLSQERSLSPAQLKYMHQEKPDDRYLPNAHNNKLTTPAYRTSNRTKSGFGTSSVVTVQVNVNADGRNISGDAANEPSIAIDPANRNTMVIGWRQFDNISSNFRQAGWAFTSNGGLSWTFPGVIEPGIFRSDPVLDIDADGNFHYNSLTNDPNYFCKVFKSTNGGAAWNTGTDAAGGDKQWMVIDRTNGPGRGNIYSFWSYYFSTCEPGFFVRSANGGESYESCITVNRNPYWGTMAIGNEGELFIAGVPSNPDSLVVVRSFSAQLSEAPVSWDQSVLVNFDGSPTGWQGVNPGGLLGQVNIDIDHSDGPGRGNVYLLASVQRSSNGDPCDVHFASSTDNGLTWSAPVRVNDDQSATNYQWFGTMSVAPNGRIDAIWLDTRNAPAGSDSSALYYSYSTDQGKSWSANERLSELFDSHIGYPNQEKLGDYFDMVSDSTGAHLAWAATFNGEQDVYYSYIVPPLSTGITEPATASRIAIYPNPATGNIHITGLDHSSQIEIHTILGETIHAVTNQGTACEINLTGFPAGIYLLRVVSPDGKAEVRKVRLE